MADQFVSIAAEVIASCPHCSLPTETSKVRDKFGFNSYEGTSIKRYLCCSYCGKKLIFRCQYTLEPEEN